ncbi:hypothetical protein V1264_019182 [Littorina saxatilis]|uniref:RNA-directed DNA polymerase n=1 Tax=Littorina saxatilis TaxID=31220 RepID=A0AAN9BJS7_9CAEN
MAQPQPYVPAIASFDPNGDSSKVGQEWKRWKRGFQVYLGARGETPDEQKKALLLHTAGMEVQDVFETVPDSENKNYTQTLEALDEKFAPQMNESYERHVFRSMSQEESETVDQFITRLRQQAKNCGFDDKLDENVRDQVIHGCKSSKLRVKLLEKKELTLKTLADTARAHEAAQKQARQMTGDVKSESAHAVHRHSPGHQGQRYRGQQSTFQKKPTQSDRPRQSDKQEERACFNCGLTTHLARDPKCPARGKECKLCHKKNHYARCCRSKKQKARGNVKSLEEDYEDDSEEVFIVGRNKSSTRVTVNVGGIDLNFMVDSGASCNIISFNTWKWLKQKNVLFFNKEQSHKKLYVYASKEPLKLKGKFTAELRVGDNKVVAEVEVLDGDGESLLGVKTAKALNILHIGLPPEKPITVNSVNIDHCEKRHPKLYEGLGKLKDHQVHVYVKKDVKPVAQSPRRIPFSLRSKVEEKIAELEAAEIIEKVDGPTPWVSPIVVVPKPNGEIRLCVDMRRANEAVERQRYPMPTVEETLIEMNGSTVFTKLDLKWGFHQLELDEESRGITTFASHNGLYRYRRLNFGICSAPELYQFTIQQVLQDCEGARNMTDDIIVHGKNMEEHDQRLEKVLDKLEKSGLTLNAQKCVFRMKEIEYMGFVLNEKGVSPAPSKVEDVKNARRPETAAEVRSFLGLVNFNAKFIRNLAAKAETLRKLTRQEVTFRWGKDEEEAFCTLKADLAEAVTLGYFDTQAETRIVADAGPVALGAVLIQHQNGEDRVISYASRSLSDVERRYSQTEKEALGLVWACEKFHQYVYGVKFELITDHRPLEFIYSKRSKPSARIERWVLRLQSYNFTVKYRPGKTNIADPLSRLVDKEKRPTDTVADLEDYIYLVTKEAVPKAMSMSEIDKESEKDEELKTLREAIQTEKWEKMSPSYRAVKNELTCLGNIVIRGTRIQIRIRIRILYYLIQRNFSVVHIKRQNK